VTKKAESWVLNEPWAPLSDRYAANPAVKATFTRFTAWKNRSGGAYAWRLGHVEFNTFKVIDNGNVGIEITYTDACLPYNGVGVHDSFVFGKS
jgi:hypothetical protein